MGQLSNKNRSGKGIITSRVQRYQNPSLGTRCHSLKRTLAALTVLLGLTAVMIGLYISEFKAVADILSGYIVLFP